MSKKYEAIASAMGECYESRTAFLAEFSYHYGRTGADRIFTDGRDYYAISKRAPKTQCGQPWEAHKDQFLAEKLGLILWVSKMQEASNERG
jgi:hypothetical protein